jgi:hypothetical protein
MNAWIGSEYQQQGRILILGESWYGDDEPLTGYIQRWARGEQQDTLFACLYNSLSGRRQEQSTPAQRLAWWQTIAFCNFIPGSLGATNDQRPTPAQFRAARVPFASTLVELAPKGVWIVGIGQAEHSQSVVKDFGAIFEVVRHPRSGVSAMALKQSWEALHAKVAAAA